MNDDNKHELALDRIFQRVNFFLIGTAFLITAFATVVTSNTFSSQTDCRIVVLAHAINTVGLYLAIFFTITNYWNVKLLKQPSANKNQPPYTLRSLISEMFRDLYHISLAPFDLSKGHPAPHTWLVPMGFVIFWFLVWFLVLQNYWVPIAVGILIPIVYMIIRFIIKFIIRLTNRKAKEGQ